MSATTRMVVGRMLTLIAIAMFALVGRSAFAAPTQQAAVNVSIKDFKFDPPALTVAAGTTVTWTNLDKAPHTATSTVGGKFDTGELQQGESKAITLNEVGTFEYFCLVHPKMIATLTVAAGEAAAPVTAALPNTGMSDNNALLAGVGLMILLAGLALTRSSRRRTTLS